MQPHTLNTKQQIIFIKNMVSESCIKVVKWELERTGFIIVEHIELGKAALHFNEGVINLDFIKAVLNRNGFDLISDEDTKLVEQVKATMVEIIIFGNNTQSMLRNSDFLAKKLGYSYSHISKVFNRKETATLEKYIIRLKIEKVKELISYEELSLSEISFQLGYSSVAHLSGQFKQVTGLSVQDYKKDFKQIPRIPINKI
jgi:AraC-like DNA-binding protein